MKNKEEMKKWIVLILVAVCSFWSLNNLTIIGELIKKIFNILLPFLLGGVMAFTLNIPMKHIEKLLKKKIKNRDGLVRIISIILVLILFIGVIFFIALLLLPELIENIVLLIGSIPDLIDNADKYISKILNKYPDIHTQLQSVFPGTNSISDLLSNLLNYFLNGSLNFITELVSGFITLCMGLIFSIYMLSQKEYLIRGTKKVLYATMNKKTADRVLNIGANINRTFSKFLSGQCLEAIILGTLIFTVCTIFKFPYAILISLLATVTSLIPIFGALIALAAGFILIAITDPVQGLVFILVFELTQQFEANFIYPRVVGKSIGLSPLWTLLAITIGGKLFGIIGMIIGLPIASVVYSIVREVVHTKLEEKNIDVA